MTGLQEALLRDPRLDITCVLPSEKIAEEFTASSPEVIPVRSLTGFTRILRDMIYCQSWARRAHADVVLVPHEYSPPVRRSAVVNVVQNILYLHPEGRKLHQAKSAIMRVLVRATHRFASRTICVSPQSAALWEEFTGTVPYVLPQGIHQTFGTPATHPRRERLITILTGPGPHKHSEMAQELAAAARLKWPDWEVQLFGVADDQTGHPATFMSREEIAGEFRRSHVVVLSSTIESFGLPAFEARAAGAHVVVHPGTAMAHWLADDQYTHVAGGVGASQLLGTLAPVVDTLTPATAMKTFLWQNVGPAWSDAMTDIHLRS